MAKHVKWSKFYGHGKIPIIFQQYPKLLKGGGICHSNIEWHSEWLYAGPLTTHSVGQSFTMQNTFVLLILHYEYMYMKCSKFNSTLYGILFVVIPYNLIEFQTFPVINHCRYTVIRMNTSPVSQCSSHCKPIQVNR